MIRELHIYDFDATLFMSPMHPDDWEGHIGSWYDTLRSLSEPCVIDPPDDLWIESTVQDALASIANPDVYAILMTGRSRRGDLVARIMELISMRGLVFDEVHLKPGGGTLPWKSSMIEDFASKMPDLQVIQIWEDRENHLQSFVELIQSLGLEAVPHFVNVTLDTPCDLGGEPVSESMLREYVKIILEGQIEEPDMTQYVDDLEDEIFSLLFQKSTFDHLQSQDEDIESTMVMDISLFDEYDNIDKVHLGILVNDSGEADIQAAYVCVPEERNQSNLVLSVNIPRDYPHVDGFQDWLSAELADALSHEIQHSCDTSEMLGEDIPEGEAKWESLESIEKYYASEAETRGHVAGILGRSRRTSKNPSELLQYDIETVMMKALERGYTKEEMMPIAQRIYGKWLDRLDDRSK